VENITAPAPILGGEGFIVHWLWALPSGRFDRQRIKYLKNRRKSPGTGDAKCLEQF
jgi:hypothetical protein